MVFIELTKVILFLGRQTALLSSPLVLLACPSVSHATLEPLKHLNYNERSTYQPIGHVPVRAGDRGFCPALKLSFTTHYKTKWDLS